jgi:hypothetical protein
MTALSIRILKPLCLDVYRLSARITQLIYQRSFQSESASHTNATKQHSIITLTRVPTCINQLRHSLISFCKKRDRRTRFAPQAAAQVRSPLLKLRPQSSRAVAIQLVRGCHREQQRAAKQLYFSIICRGMLSERSQISVDGARPSPDLLAASHYSNKHRLLVTDVRVCVCGFNLYVASLAGVLLPFFELKRHQQRLQKDGWLGGFGGTERIGRTHSLRGARTFFMPGRHGNSQPHCFPKGLITFWFSFE